MDNALGALIDSGARISAKDVEYLVCKAQHPNQVKDPIIVEINLQIYDSLFEEMAVAL